MRKRAVVLLSGGLDSATVLAIARTEGYETYALTMRYGQRHAQEIEAARWIAASMLVSEHRILDIDLGTFGGSALTSDLPVPKGGPIVGAIPITYVPARNTIFLSFALAWTEVLPAKDIFIGVNAVDFSGYPDCRPEYIDAFERMANVATREGGIRVHAPLIHLTKADIIKHGLELGVDYSLTSSCYDPTDEGPCGACDACYLRKKGFDEAGVPDPLKTR